MPSARGRRAVLAPFIFALLALFCFMPLSATTALAEGWHAPLQDIPEAPTRLIAVDKEGQTLHLVERKSPLAIVASFTCTTGQQAGDKLVEGDQRTPEGIYFVERIINGGLDWEMYGSRAYTLNYPNPVDRLRGKTGYGIWIHSKGRDIVPMETQGCIAINLSDIERLEPDYGRGTAVAVAHSIIADAATDPENAARAEIARETVRLTHVWAQAWSSRSEEMFDLYDGPAYAKAQRESFAAFCQQKERLFATLPWIHTFAADVQVLSGPGYWVTWFNQYYRAPNLKVEGVRRLYWQQGEDGQPRIVGMEWKPGNLGLEQRYLSEYLTPSVTAFVKDWQTAWQSADLAAYSAAYAPAALQGKQRGAAAIAQHKQTLWAAKRPVLVEFSQPELGWTAEGLTVRMRQVYEDSSGYADTGIKELVLAPHGAGWHILRENWRAAE